MRYVLRRAGQADMPVIRRMIAEGRASLAERGIDQWRVHYPDDAAFACDLAVGQLWVLSGPDGTPAAVAALCFGEDPTYRRMTDGRWTEDAPYAAIHRVAVSASLRGQGIAGELFGALCAAAAQNGMRWVRADTHSDNASMRRALEKSGFVLCGKIRTAHDEPRVAYEKRLCAPGE